VVALDPGTVDTGVCLAQDGEILATTCLHVPKSWKALKRVVTMGNQVGDYITRAIYACRPQIVQTSITYESPVTFTGEDGYGRPIISLHQLVAVIEFWAQANEIPTFPYTVNQVKEGVHGSPQATKEQVEYIMRQEHGMHDQKLSSHEWDAISILTYHRSQVAWQEKVIN